MKVAKAKGRLIDTTHRRNSRRMRSKQEAPTLNRGLFDMYRLLYRRRTHASATFHQHRLTRHQTVSQEEG